LRGKKSKLYTFTIKAITILITERTITITTKVEPSVAAEAAVIGVL
jgi:hypothetical protein